MHTKQTQQNKGNRKPEAQKASNKSTKKRGTRTRTSKQRKQTKPEAQKANNKGTKNRNERNKRARQKETNNRRKLYLT